MSNARNPPDRDEWRIPTPPRTPRIEMPPPSGSLGAASMSGAPGVTVTMGGKNRVHVGTAALVAVVASLAAGYGGKEIADNGAGSATEYAVQDLRRELRELRQEMRQEIRELRAEVRSGGR